MHRLFLLLTILLGNAAFAAETIDMDRWETQVLGAIHGSYCGYYPDRLTLVGGRMGFAGFKQCSEVFASVAPACVKKLKAEKKWRVADASQGAALGSDVGSCIDTGFSEWVSQRASH